MSHEQMISEYLSGPEQLRRAVEGMTAAQLQAAPIAGKWSTLQVVCHIADFEPIYADRIKRVIAEDNPVLLPGDADLFAARLCYSERDVAEELELISAVRRQLGRILRQLPGEMFQRTGQHSRDGALSVEELLRRITRHIPHHVPFIEEKRRALG